MTPPICITSLLNDLVDRCRSYAGNPYPPLTWGQFDRAQGGYEYWAVDKIVGWAGSASFEDFWSLNTKTQLRLVNLSLIHPIFEEALAPILTPLWDRKHVQRIAEFVFEIEHDYRGELGSPFILNAKSLTAPVVVSVLQLYPDVFERTFRGFREHPKPILECVHAYVAHHIASPEMALNWFLDNTQTLSIDEQNEFIKTLGALDWFCVLERRGYAGYIVQKAWDCIEHTAEQAWCLAQHVKYGYDNDDDDDGYNDAWSDELIGSIFAHVQWDTAKIKDMFHRRMHGLDTRFLGRLLLEFYQHLPLNAQPFLDEYFAVLHFPKMSEELSDVVAHAKNKMQRTALIEYVEAVNNGVEKTVPKKKM